MLEEYKITFDGLARDLLTLTLGAYFKKYIAYRLT